jgi:hypothetical protein
MDFKKEYIKMRNSGKYELDFFFNYYISKGGIINDPNEFTETFLYAHEIIPTPPGFPEMKRRVVEVDRQAILNHMDSVFELQILIDRNNNFIKIVE